ncbi:MAG: hypothetical protein M3O55_03765 [Actinomycetota bacterium]|nr:hypothetical protein [Actinomycetota bacterium]
MRSRRVIVLSVVLLALLALTGCSQTARKAAPKATSPSASAQPPATASTPATGSIAGAWNGTFTVTGQPGQGTFTVTFATAGSALTGTIHINNSTCVSDGTITGTLSGTQINFGAVRAAQKISFTGALVADKLAGSYSAPACPGGSGTWAATRA